MSNHEKKLTEFQTSMLSILVLIN